MADPKFAVTKLHPDLFEVVPKEKDASKRSNIAQKIRTANKKQGLDYKVATRGDSIFVARSKEAVEAIPPSSAGRTAGTFDLAASLDAASKNAG